MEKLGYSPKCMPSHIKAIREFEKRKGDPKFVSPKFSDFGDVMKWLDEK